MTERRGILRGGSLELPAPSSPAGRLTPARRVWLSSASEANGLPAACARLAEGSVAGCVPAASCTADGEETDAPGEAGGLTFMAWMDRLTRRRWQASCSAPPGQGRPETKICGPARTASADRRSSIPCGGAALAAPHTGCPDPAHSIRFALPPPAAPAAPMRQYAARAAIVRARGSAPPTIGEPDACSATSRAFCSTPSSPCSAPRCCCARGRRRCGCRRAIRCRSPSSS